MINLYIISQTIGLILFERVPLPDIFNQFDNSKLEPDTDEQLSLFWTIPDTSDRHILLSFIISVKTHTYLLKTLVFHRYQHILSPKFLFLYQNIHTWQKLPFFIFRIITFRTIYFINILFYQICRDRPIRNRSFI